MNPRMNSTLAQEYVNKLLTCWKVNESFSCFAFIPDHKDIKNDIVGKYGYSTYEDIRRQAYNKYCEEGK